jgi:hypothetical protein
MLGMTDPVACGCRTRARRMTTGVFPLFVASVVVSVMWSLTMALGWKEGNHGSIVFGQWVKVITLTGATRETLDKLAGVTLRCCV